MARDDVFTERKAVAASITIKKLVIEPKDELLISNCAHIIIIRYYEDLVHSIRSDVGCYMLYIYCDCYRQLIIL